ncbi:MAG: glycosyltransferase [Pirellulales bacterium]
MLHVGSCIPRKRIDVLIAVFASLRDAFPDLKLVKIGDQFSTPQLSLIQSARLGDSVVHLGKVDRKTLIDAYRNAAAVLVPSEYEGFGLPVIEGLACGAAVVCSDTPNLREAGGIAASYAPVANIEAWHDVLKSVLATAEDSEARRTRRAWAARFTWDAHATAIADAYRELLPT